MADTQSASQTVTLGSNSTVYLNFWRLNTATPQNTSNFFSVLVDGMVVVSVDADDLPVDPAYQPVSVDIGAFADGGTHTIEFQFNHSTNARDTNIFIDNVSIDVTPISP